MRIAFVLPYGERRDGFFPDTLAGLLCAQARRRGHEGTIVRVYYEPDRHAEVGARLVRWLAERAIELVVVERLFDPAPIVEHGAPALLLTRGEPFEPVPGIGWVIGANPSPTARGTKRSPEIGELVAAFDDFLDDRARASRVEAGRLVHAEPTRPARMPRPVHPVLEQEVIALGDPPLVRRKTIFGNAGCPYASDPLDAPHPGVRLPIRQIARLGCAFCSMGGDYQKRPDADVVEELVEQAAWIADGAPDVTDLVLSDQHALRYLPALMTAARELRPMRWLFAARADAFVRERARVEAAIRAAGASSHVLESYLSGFESFCDRELARYNKGCSVSDLVAAVEAMRELARAYPSSFDYARARGHSLILFSPWTTPEDLAETVATMRAHRLGELFDEIGRNRLRLYTDLPITLAAARDGAVLGAWDEGDAGAGEAKGYPTELPWRFLDPRTRRVRERAEALRRTLGSRTELAQLAASIEDGELEGLDALIEALGSRPGGAHRAASAVLVAGDCNNRCAACPNREDFRDDATLIARLEATRKPLVLAGREPTMHPRFVDALRSAGDACVVTNARRFASEDFAREVEQTGALSAASVKLFAIDADDADRIAAVEGAHREALTGWQRLRGIVRTLELRVVAHAENLDTLPAFADWAACHGADGVFVEATLDGVGLARLGRAAAAIGALIERCDALGLPVETAPLSAGATRFDRIPTGRRGRAARVDR